MRNVLKIVTGNDLPLIDSLIKSFHMKFSLKDLGELNYFLGMQVHYLESKFIIIKLNILMIYLRGSSSLS